MSPHHPLTSCAAFAGSLPILATSTRIPVVSPRARSRLALVPRRCRRRASSLFPLLATTAAPATVDSTAGDEQADVSGDTSDGSDEDPASTSGVQGVIDTIADLVNDSFEQLVWPFIGSCSVVREQWERSGGNFVLRPPGQAKAVLHFVGGAFVGAAPHIAYSTLLSRLAARGYCVVATPFDLSLNYLETTSAIMEKWEAVETGLALDYGPIPVVGLGHSAGALFHCIASSLFDDISPKAAHVLISYNNKPIKSAIPAYDLLVTPIAKQSVSLEQSVPENVREALESIPGTVDAAVEGSPFAPTLLKQSLMPILKDARRVAEQLPPLIMELAGVPRTRSTTAPSQGAENETTEPLSEFYPPPEDIQAAVTNMYSTEQTLVVKFNSDTIDESEVVMENVRRRGAPIEVSMMELDGNHLTPLTQGLPEPADLDTAIGGLDLGPLDLVASGIREAISAVGSRELNNLESLIDEWIDASVVVDD